MLQSPTTLLFNGSRRSVCVVLNNTNTDLFRGDRILTLMLSTADPGVMLNLNSTNVMIVESDCELLADVVRSLC